MILTTPSMPSTPCTVAVVMPTVVRPSLLRAVRSVFQQDVSSPCHLLLGIDHLSGDPTLLDQLLQERPAHWHVSIFNPGYSTSVRHGGLHPARDGGALRTILSYAAHSRYVAYLDDDNWWAPQHLSNLLAAVQDHQWAYSQRWFVDAQSLQPLAIDTWESVGPGAGVFNNQFGGFVDPNTLLLDKLACETALRWWTLPLAGDKKAMSADRNVFAHLRRHYAGRATGQPTCFYRMDPDDGLHTSRMKAIQRQSVNASEPATAR
ncbi:MAG TPA: glycosyltransferase family 2 protein [Phycisphaerae bacterium]|nr:glycosyltransferase family 2 protein [Phycisphaerae bacterium]